MWCENVNSETLDMCTCCSACPGTCSPTRPYISLSISVENSPSWILSKSASTSFIPYTKRNLRLSIVDSPWVKNEFLLHIFTIRKNWNSSNWVFFEAKYILSESIMRQYATLPPDRTQPQKLCTASFKNQAKNEPKSSQNATKSDSRGPKIPPRGASSTWNM